MTRQPELVRDILPRVLAEIVAKATHDVSAD